MNLILFEPGEITRPLPAADPRAAHILGVLRRRPGERFDAGVVNGARGKATLVAAGADALTLDFEAVEVPARPPEVHLILALPRPQTARKVLAEAASLGVRSLRFFRADKAERSYAQSSLWTTGEWRRHLVSGAEQAFDTHLPEVGHFGSLAECLSSLPGGCSRIGLDNYEAAARMAPGLRPAPLALAFGPERGWSAPERDLLRRSGFALAHLGPRVLRTETAVVAAVALFQAAV